jgi:hypothetical protein
MKDQNTREQKLKILFATYPTVDIFFMTSDDKGFFDNGSAGAHASTLKDKNVQSYSRQKVQADEELEKSIAAKKAAEETERTAAAEKKAAEEKAAKEAAEKAQSNAVSSDTPEPGNAEAGQTGDDDAEETGQTGEKDVSSEASAKDEPSEAMTKEQLADWLNEHDVEFNLRDTKPTLLEAAQNKYNELTKTSDKDE